MFTTVEGDWDEVMSVIRQCMDDLLTDSPRVSLVIKIDERPGVSSALDAKVESVQRHLHDVDDVEAEGTAGTPTAGRGAGPL